MGFARFRGIPGYLVTPGGVEPPLQDRKSWVLGRWTMEPRQSLLQKNIAVARPVRLERTTYRFEVWRSIQLSYGREVQIYDITKKLSSGFQVPASAYPLRFSRRASTVTLMIPVSGTAKTIPRMPMS